MSEPKKTREQLLAELRAIRVRAEREAVELRTSESPPAAAERRAGSATVPRRLAEAGRAALPDRPPMKFLVGIEDTTYFHWQVAILCESLLGQLPEGWELLVVVCNDHQAISSPLLRVFETYPLRYFTGANHPERQDIDFSAGGETYKVFNKIEALRVAAGRIEDDDLVCLMDSDIFLHRELDPSIFPRGDALCENWIIGEETFLQHRPEPGAIDLHKLLEAIGCREKIQPGGVTIFLSGRTVRTEKFVHDCFRFTQVVYLLGRIAGRESVWWAEMPCYALALAANGIRADLVGNGSFVIDKPESIPSGSFYHYYADLEDGGVDGAFHGSPWGKQAFSQTDFLRSDLDTPLARAVTDHERYFFELAKRAADRLGRTPADGGRG